MRTALWRLVVLLLAVVAAGPAWAQGDAPAGEVPQSILVVDLQDAMRRSTAMLSIEAELQELRQSYQQEFVALEQEFREIEQQLLLDSETLDEDALRQRRRQFELRVAAAQHQVQDRRMALDRGQAEAVDRVRAAILEIVGEVAEEYGARVVLAKSQVVVVDRSLDITDQVVARLNDRLPVVEVTVASE